MWRFAAIMGGAAAAAWALTRRRSGGEVFYRPHSPEAVELFTEAAAVVGVPATWAHGAIHDLMDAESSGWAGRPNYQFNQIWPGISRKTVENARRWPSLIWEPLRQGRREEFFSRGITSTATGLGQLTTSNVPDHYPDGLAGIGDPLNEAAGMLSYVRSRYGSPDRALAFHRLPRCEGAQQELLLSGSNRVSRALELGCKHHEGY